MGCRSNVTAYFYLTSSTINDVTRNKAMALFKLWWAAVKEDPMYAENFAPHFTETPNGLLYEEGDTKWYESYPDVIWFNALVRRYQDELIDNVKLDGGSGLNTWFCYEFVRLGEESNDIEQEACGDTDWKLQVDVSTRVEH